MHITYKNPDAAHVDVVGFGLASGLARMIPYRFKAPQWQQRSIRHVTVYIDTLSAAAVYIKPDCYLGSEMRDLEVTCNELVYIAWASATFGLYVTSVPITSVWHSSSCNN